MAASHFWKGHVFADGVKMAEMQKACSEEQTFCKGVHGKRCKHYLMMRRNPIKGISFAFPALMFLMDRIRIKMGIA